MRQHAHDRPSQLSRYNCPSEHETACLDRRLLRREITTDEHGQAIRDLDPHDGALIARMSEIAMLQSPLEGRPEWHCN